MESRNEAILDIHIKIPLLKEVCSCKVYANCCTLRLAIAWFPNSTPQLIIAPYYSLVPRPHAPAYYRPLHCAIKSWAVESGNQAILELDMLPNLRESLLLQCIVALTPPAVRSHVDPLVGRGGEGSMALVALRGVGEVGTAAARTGTALHRAGK